MIGCIVQARMGSSRLPGKTLLKLGKTTILNYVIDQIQFSKKIEKFVIATTYKDEDKKICDYAKKLKITCFRGNSSDVLTRYYKCAKKFSFTTIIRITADNPLIDPQIIDKMIAYFYSSGVDVLTNALSRTFPYGTEVEIFSFKALENAWKNAKKSDEHEHVTAYFYNHPEKFKIISLKNKENLSKFRWTLDEISDYNLIKKIVLKIKHQPILMPHILKLLSNSSNLPKSNQSVTHNEIMHKKIKTKLLKS